MARSGFKMKGYGYAGISPLSKKEEKEKKEELKETRTSTTITKSKGDRSSTYTMDKSKTKINKDGSKTYTFTSPDGVSIKETHSSQ